MNLGLEIRIIRNVRIRISIFEILCILFLGKMDKFDFFDPNLPKNGVWSLNFENISTDAESAFPRYHRQNGQL